MEHDAFTIASAPYFLLLPNIGTRVTAARARAVSGDMSTDGAMLTLSNTLDQ